ncbi:unnamed protein product [Brassica oleracea]
MINSMVEDDEFTCAGSVLKQLFSEEKLILVYRFSFEIEKARKNFDLLPSPEISGTRKEIEKRPTTHQRNYLQYSSTNGEDQSPSDYREESIIRLNVDEEHDYLNDDWEEVVSGQQNWDNGIDPECFVTAAIPHYLTSRTNDDDTSTPGFNVNVVDLDTSSTGSTGDVNVTIIGNTCWNPINVPMTENSDRGQTSKTPSKTVNGAAKRGMTELLPDVYVNVTDDSDIPHITHLQTPRRQSFIGEDDSCSEIIGKKATHTVIGGMMKEKFAGRGGSPRPNDIRQAMQGDHDVHILYWKAWRSREVALDYAKGSCGASYNFLPTYLEKLVMANPGSITQIHTEYADGIGHRLKYMFLDLAVSIEGYRFMRKVVIVDGTHLRGKYVGCLLTASAQDGNYQVFPLAGAVAATLHVNLYHKTCTCYEFQALMIPCIHAIAAATRAQIRIDSLVDDCYSRSTYRAAYSKIINHVVEYESIEILSSESSVSGVEINPPSSRRPPGRPRKSQILSRGEFQMRRPKKRTVCSRCKCAGHNRATCKVAI